MRTISTTTPSTSRVRASQLLVLQTDQGLRQTAAVQSVSTRTCQPGSERSLGLPSAGPAAGVGRSLCLYLSGGTLKGSMSSRSRFEPPDLKADYLVQKFASCG